MLLPAWPSGRMGTSSWRIAVTIACWSFRPGQGAGRRRFGQPGMTIAVRPTQVSVQTLAAPQGVAVDPAGNLYVADAGANRVLIFPNTQNAPVAGMAAAFVIGQASFGTSGSGNFKTPTDVGVDSSGSIYVADNGNNRVLIYPSLVFLPLLSTP